ncbi:membrane protein [Firmicutes bacterium CAG:631]|nr:membrane protein [Firmicutes bacterium CAG:631]
MWVVAAIFSALFAGITTILSKCGLKNTNSNLATALRTSVVLLLAWLIVWITGAFKTITDISFNYGFF